MRVAARVLFYGYVGLLVVAGAWGIVGARADFSSLLQFPLEGSSPSAEANLVSQYRFLRAMELGFGGFALIFRTQVFTRPAFNRLFLGTMGAGVLARVVSLVADGRPSPIMLVFLAWEAVGVLLIAWDTREVLLASPAGQAVPS